MKTFLKMLFAFVFLTISSYISFVLYETTKMYWVFIVGIIMGYIAIHFILMFITAPIIFLIFRMKYNYHHSWFIPKKFEEKLYRILKVKKWKTKIPTYDSRAYSLSKQNITKAIQMTCHAEIVHEVIAVLSYLPILFALIISKFGLFIVLSFVFSVIHLLFSIVQRYNRPRLVLLNERIQKSKLR
jgi:hypothetical protein